MTTATASRPVQSARPFEQKLALASQLQRRSGTLLHRRVSLLAEVFADRGYREYLANEVVGGPVDDLAVGERLDPYLADTGFRFLQLRAVLERFPDAADWKRPVADLWESLRSAKPESDEPVRKARRVTLAEYAQLKEERDRLARRVADLEAELRDAHVRIALLEQRQPAYAA